MRVVGDDSVDADSEEVLDDVFAATGCQLDEVAVTCGRKKCRETERDPQLPRLMLPMPKAFHLRLIAPPHLQWICLLPQHYSSKREPTHSMVQGTTRIPNE